ncbi:MAG: prepilin-type N-terminal cleavage/methylation domain-containing protein, partial [Erysipelotrichaceae bacterium]|nr:prepilin-type N-terminal cleavage/methylation domain-containing protein [Erysipelotrichaceae bacterium]
MIKDKSKKNKGLTLMELLVAIAIFFLIMIVVSKFVGDIFHYEDVFSGGLTTYDEARKVLQPVTSEIRSASPSSLGSYPIQSTEANKFIFFADINEDGLKEKVRYELSGDTL